MLRPLESKALQTGREMSRIKAGPDLREGLSRLHSPPLDGGRFDRQMEGLNEQKLKSARQLSKDLVSAAAPRATVI